jgi:hypothetical protein
MVITSELRLLRLTKTCEITLRNYYAKQKKNRNYVTLWRIRNLKVKIGVYMAENTL